MSQSRPSSRPLSPHLQVYKPQITSTLSILHRLSGLWLAVAAITLVLWLYGLAFAPTLYDSVVAFFSTGIGKILLFSWVLAFNYHLCNGIRHLFWDSGKGFEIPQVYRSGYLVLVAALILTVIVWVVARA
jgi:succinate dehydrogenase / fumarate reductase cytochrome b subunit